MRGRVTTLRCGYAGAEDERGADDQHSTEDQMVIGVGYAAEYGVVGEDAIEAAEPCSHCHDDQEKREGSR